MRREIYAPGSSRWRDPRAQLLAGEAWANAKGPVLTALSLPENPDRLLDEHARTLDARVPAGRRGGSARTPKVTVDDDGKLHVSALKAIPDPASLVELRGLLEGMVPQGERAGGDPRGDVLAPRVRAGVHLRVRRAHPPCRT